MKRLFGLISGLICLITVLLPAACLSAGARFYLRGDADGDGKITSLDVTTAQRVLTGIITDDDGSITRRSDVTGDGLTLPDATAIQRYLAGFADPYQIGQSASEKPTVNPALPTEENQLPILCN